MNEHHEKLPEFNRPVFGSFLHKRRNKSTSRACRIIAGMRNDIGVDGGGLSEGRPNHQNSVNLTV